MTAKPATVRSVMRIYYKSYKCIMPTHFAGTRLVAWDDRNGVYHKEFRNKFSAPVEFVRWPEKTK